MELRKDREVGPKEYPAPVAASRLPSMDVQQEGPQFEDSADIRDYVEVVLRRKWLVLNFVVGVFITTLVVSLAMKPIFKAQGRLELSIQAPKVTKFEDVVATQMQTREFMQTQVKLLQSESLARRVIEKLHIDQNEAFNPKIAKDKEKAKDGKEKDKDKEKESDSADWMETISGWFSGSKEGAKKGPDPGLERMRLQRSIEAIYAKSLEVQPERDTTIISLAFSSTDAPLTRDIINSHIQEFIGWQMDKKIDAASSAKRQLEKQLDVARISLERAESNLNAFAQRAGIVSLDANLNLIYKQLEEMNKAFAAAEGERINKEAIYTQTQKGSSSSMPPVLANDMIRRLREEYVKAVVEYEELYSTFKDDYPKLKSLKAKMQDFEKKIGAEEARIIDSVKHEYLTALKREEALRKEAELKKTLALELNNQATQYKILEREVETSKAIHQSLLERAKEIDANVGTGLGNIQVVDYADLPLKPHKPNVQLNLLLAVVVGLMGGVGLAFLLEYLDNTVKRIDEISDRFRIAVLGVLPMADPDEVKDLDFLVKVKPKSSFSESIRTAKVSIQLSSSMDKPPQLLMVTSTSAGEGKSTISCNLAQAFASSEERVVIIDCDLRKPRLHKVFASNGKKHKGLSHYLSGICDVDDIIQKTDDNNLCFISAGPVPPNPAELLASTRMKRLLDDLCKGFERVLIDAPPAAGFADVLALGNCVDGVILVSTLGQTQRESLRIFRRSLYNVRGNLLGCIVNKLSVTNHYGGYYYRYYKYYHYYYHRAYGEQAESLPEETRKDQD